MSRSVLRFVILGVFVFVAVVFVRRVLEPEPPTVSVISPEIGTVEATITNSRAGTVRARRRAKLSPEVGGTVVALPFREGDSVSSGAVVLALDDRLQQARLEVSRRDLEVARAERKRACLFAERALRELHRGRQLTDQGIASTDRLDSLESAASSTEAACQAAAAGEERAISAVELSRAELSKMSLHAPFDGVIAKLTIEIGEYSTPAPPAVPVPPVIDLLDRQSIYISAPMDEVDVGKLAVGLEALVTVDSHRDRELRGRIVRVAPYVEDIQSQNRTLEIEVELADKDIAAELFPGSSADVEVILERHLDVLRIPAPSLSGTNRLLLVEDGVIAAAEIEVGLTNWDWVEVISGIDRESLIVTSDHSLEPGTAVQVSQGITTE